MPNMTYSDIMLKFLSVGGNTFTVDSPVDWVPGTTGQTFGFARIQWPTNIALKNFSIYGANGTITDILGSVEGFSAQGMTFDGVSGSYAPANWAVSGDFIQIRNNIWKNGMYGYANYSTRVTVSGNQFLNIGSNGNPGFEMGQGNVHINVSNNFYFGWASSGTYLIGGNGRDITITGNHIEAMNAQNVIIQLAGQEVVVSDNSIRTLNQSCFSVMGDRTLPAYAANTECSANREHLR